MDLTIGSADFNSLCWAWFHGVTRADLSLSISFSVVFVLLLPFLSSWTEGQGLKQCF